MFLFVGLILFCKYGGGDVRDNLYSKGCVSWMEYVLGNISNSG